MPITLEVTGEGEEKIVKIRIECECGTTTEHSAPYESFFVVKNNFTEEKEDRGLDFSCSNFHCDRVYTVKSNGDYGIKKKQQYIPSVRPHYPYLKRV